MTSRFLRSAQDGAHIGVSRRSLIATAGAATLVAGIGTGAAGAQSFASLRQATPDAGEATPTADSGVIPAAATQTYPFELPDLPYEFDALEPVISAEINELHWGELHRLHVTNANLALSGVEELVAGLTLEEVAANVATIPTDEIPDADGAVAPRQVHARVNVGGHYNHALWWEIMSPDGGGEPAGALADAVTAAFGDFSTMQEAFRLAAIGNVGSGWVWLVADPSGAVTLQATPDQDNPIVLGTGFPVFGIDHWEHSYVQQYGGNRGAYIDAWWEIANWDAITQRYEAFLGIS